MHRASISLSSVHTHTLYVQASPSDFPPRKELYTNTEKILFPVLLSFYSSSPPAFPEAPRGSRDERPHPFPPFLPILLRYFSPPTTRPYIAIAFPTLALLLFLFFFSFFLVAATFLPVATTPWYLTQGARRGGGVRTSRRFLLLCRAWRMIVRVRKGFFRLLDIRWIWNSLSMEVISSGTCMWYVKISNILTSSMCTLLVIL